jgi:site-specific DNA-methyltransferase (adenine-specific)
MSFEEKAKHVRVRAQNIASRVASWADYSNALFDQEEGLVARTFADPVERQSFYDTEHYQALYDILDGLIKKFGEVEGAIPEHKSGRFVVRLPKSLHAKLDVEAKREGVSLNQLATTKLAFPLRERVTLDVERIVTAYRETYGGYSTDRVVVDPKLNAAFLARCRKKGLTQSDYHINHALLDVRKSSKANLPEATKKTIFRDYDDYAYASEIAVRVLQRLEGVSLDRILCDPALAARFDEISASLCDEVEVLKRRLAALNLRKTRRLRPKDLSLAPVYDLVSAGPIRSINLDELSTLPATYVLYDLTRPIFAGETSNLRRRIERHTKPGAMPDWIDLRDKNITLHHFVEAKINAADRTRWLTRFINEERPLLNYQRSA